MTQVLLINDEPAIQRLEQVVLEDEGFEVIKAPNGLVALRRLSMSNVPLVVVMSTRVPYVGALGVLDAAEHEPALGRHAYVLVTALSDGLPASLRALVRRLDVQVVRKPFLVEEFVSAVRIAVSHLHQACGA